MKRSAIDKIISFIKDDNGQALVEYALLTFVFALAIVGTFALTRSTWYNKWNNVKDARAADIGAGEARELLSRNVRAVRGIGP